MLLDRVDGDEQAPADLGVAVTLGEEANDLALGGSQCCPADLRASALTPSATGVGDRIRQRQFAAGVPTPGRVSGVERDVCGVCGLS